MKHAVPCFHLSTKPHEPLNQQNRRRLHGKEKSLRFLVVMERSVNEVETRTKEIKFPSLDCKGQ